MAQEHLAIASFSMLRRVPKTRIATPSRWLGISRDQAKARPMPAIFPAYDAPSGAGI